jgi:glycerol-1-phosphate dehydrogenase [NAD(P)+]
MTHLPTQIKIDYNIIPQLEQYCAAQHFDKFMLVADDNTYTVLGRAVAETLAAKGWDVKTIVLTGNQIVPDERFIMQLMVQADRQDRPYLAAGSGVITDITRFVSHHPRQNMFTERFLT